MRPLHFLSAKGLERLAAAGFLLFVALSAAPSAAEDRATVSLAEARSGDAMALADRLLPSDIRADVVEGIIRQLFAPGYAFHVGYRTARRSEADDLCAQTIYSRTLAAKPETPPDGSSELNITGSLEPSEEYAVIFPSRTADEESCEKTTGYVRMDGADKPWKLSAYRHLVAAMRRARSGASLPFKLTCQPADDAACAEPVKSLAHLPMKALFGINIDSGRRRTLSESGSVRVVQQLPVEQGQTYGVTFKFGRSGEDGNSWRVSWLMGTDGMPDLLLRRQSIIYH